MTDRIYLAGPITNMEWADAKKQFNHMAEYAIMELGFGNIVNPVDHESPDTPLPDEELWQHFMKVSIKKLASCDAILLAPNYHISRGARLEKYLAEQCGLEVYMMPRGNEAEDE